jgi:hypothetical protein
MLGLRNGKQSPVTHQHWPPSGKVRVRKEVFGMWTGLFHVAEVVLKIPEVYVAESLL